MVAIAALLPLLVLADPSSAELDGARYRSLTERAPTVAPKPWAASRELRLEVLPDGIHVVGTWTIRTRSDTRELFDGPLLPASAHINAIRWNGRHATTYASENGPATVHVVGVVEGEARLDLDAVLVQSPTAPFALLPATTGTTHVQGDGSLRLQARDGSTLWRTPDATVDPATIGGSPLLELTRPSPPPNTGTLATGTLATGVTFSDATATVKAQARWRLRRGHLSQVALTGRGIGSDLQVQGANVATWARDGDQIRVELREDARDTVVLDLSWTVPLPEGNDASFSMPTLALESTFGVQQTVQLARDGELDLLPELPGWTPVPHRTLSSTDAGLIEGVPTASFRATSDVERGEVTLLRFEPVPGPTATIDVAGLDVALAADGASMAVARYEVQNERASHLGVQLPPGARVLGVKVAGHIVAPVLDDGRLRIPLPRSVETLRGLLSVPVVVAYTLRADAWKRRHQGSVPLPVVDLPIQTQQVSVRLPARYTSRLEPGTGGRVERFDQGLHIAHGLQDADAIANADATLGRAAKAWNANEFDAAQHELDNFRDLGGEGFSEAQLQSNVDLVVSESAPSAARPRPVADATGAVTGSSVSLTSKKSAGLARRIKDRARSRSMSQRVRQSKRKRRARELKNQGRYDEAKAEYKKALDDSKDLRKLDESESQTYAAEEKEILLELDDVETQQSNRNALESTEPRQLWADEIAFVPAPNPSPRRATALVVLPRSDETVLYQLTLLPAGAERSVPLRVRRRLRRSSR